MKALLDTHTFIWWDSDPARLSPAAQAVIQDPANSITPSVVSVWDILIQSDLGKLTLARPLREILGRQQANGILILAVSLEHVLQLESLPRPHKDPVDRLMAEQAAVEEMTLISADKVFAQYPVRGLW